MCELRKYPGASNGHQRTALTSASGTMLGSRDRIWVDFRESAAFDRLPFLEVELNFPESSTKIDLGFDALLRSIEKVCCLRPVLTLSPRHSHPSFPLPLSLSYRPGHTVLTVSQSGAQVCISRIPISCLSCTTMLWEPRSEESFILCRQLRPQSTSFVVSSTATSQTGSDRRS
jgi:hypothetical protein